MNEQQRKLLLSSVILGIVAILALAYYYFMVAKDQIAAKDREITQLEDKRKALSDRIREYDKFLQREHEIEATVEAIALATQRLPSGENDRRYVDIISDSLGKTGVLINEIRRDESRRYPQYVELPNNLKGTGRYGDLVQFMSLSEQNAALFMRVAEFRIENNSKAPTLHPFELKLSTFIFTD